MKDDINTIKKLCSEILLVDYREANRLGGLTNRNYKVISDNDAYVVRLPGEGTKEMIDRNDERICTELANEINIDSELLHFEGESGVKIARYIKNANTMDKEKVKKIEHMREIAEIFKKLHTCGKSVPVIFNVFEKIEEYEAILKKSKGDFFWDDYEDVKKQIYDLKQEVDEMNIQVTICHNDPLCENFIKGNDRMYLVDWEYAGMNDPMWDIADFFIESEFNPDEEKMFSSFYFGQDLNSTDERRILINKIFVDFLWSLWGKQRYSFGADFLEYANDRYNKAKHNLELLVAVS